MDNSRSNLDEASVRLLLAEHERISTLFVENRLMGERRTTLFLTLFTLAAPVIGAFSQYTKTGLLTPMNLGAVAVLLLVGVLTFYRLIERRIVGMELLRAINRIHRYFVEHDPGLAGYLSWKPDETAVRYVEHRGTMPGLRDLVQILNCVLTGFITAGAVGLAAPAVSPVVLAFAVLAPAALAWVAQQRIEEFWLTRAQAAADQAFAGGRLGRSGESAALTLPPSAGSR